MEKGKKEEKIIEYLLHKCALLMKKYFIIQRSLLTYLKPKILNLQKRNS